MRTTGSVLPLGRRPACLTRIVRHVPAGEQRGFAMATVVFDQATRTYPGSTTPAVDRLDLRIEDGELLVLVGPSGCGKSTSLRMLAGLEDVDAGTIWVDDRDVTTLEPKDRDMAMVFQNYALYPTHDGRQEHGLCAADCRGVTGPRWIVASRTPRRCWTSRPTWTANQSHSRGASVSGSPWAAPSSVSRRSS